MRTIGLVRPALLLSACLGLAVNASGCAEERDPINRVQADALAKSFFVGEKIQDPSDDPEFYWRNYVVDGSVSQSLVTVGDWSGVERIRWEITEDRLIARRSYQWIKGADDSGRAESVPDGTVVAEFQIAKHFDIRHAYNPSTGEELNVVEENASDRPWYQREHFRVDWTENLVQTPIWTDMFLGKVFGNIELSPNTDWVSDPNHPDAPHFEPEQGYFDITQRYWVEPKMSNLMPGLPTCVVVGFYTGSATYECEAQEAIVRSSFLRLDEDTDFERLEITNAPGDVVGNPAQISYGGLLRGMVPPGEQGWDPGYGFVDALYHRFAHIHNTWKKSHLDVACGSNDDLDSDGTADACSNDISGYQGNLGSQCDVFANKCTIPVRDREIRTVGYWFNAGMPDELQDPLSADGEPEARGAAEDIIHSWDQLMKNAIALSREVECRRTGGDRDGCHGLFFEAGDEMVSYGAWLIGKVKDPTPVLTSCHNPTRAYDVHDVCGDTGYEARLGDIRRNFLAYWPHASRAPYGGVGNWGADPLTGEIHGAAAMVMGRSATRAAAFQRDAIQVALGDISIEEVTDGVPARNYAHYLQNGHTPKALSNAELSSRVASVDAERAMQQVAPKMLQDADIASQMQALVQAQKTTTHDVGALTSAQLEFDAVAGGLRGSLYEAQLVEGQWLTSVAGASPGSSADAQTMQAASPLRGLDPGAMRTMRERVSTIMQAKGICFGDHEAPTFGSISQTGLAQHFASKYPSPEYSVQERGEAIYRDLWVEAFKGIAIHEVGHSLGLLHNFASSYDSANYMPQYWQLRTHEGTAAGSCEGQPRTGDLTSVENDNCMGPRYLDPETDDERGVGAEARPRVHYFGNSSVMEYSLERFGETVGLGQYDAHSMKALYGRVLETFEDADRGGFTQDEQMAFAPRLESQLTDMDRIRRSNGPFPGQEFAKPTHYTEMARMMKLFDPARCREATDEERSRGAWRIVHGKVCAPAPRDHAAWADFEHGLTDPTVESSMAPYLRTRADISGGGNKVRWHYRYGATSNSYVHTQASDAGGDAYEATMATIELFDSRYPWTYFRRQNREYMAEALPFAASRSVFERLRAYHWNAANRNAFLRSFGEGAWNEIAHSDDWHRPMLLAETEMFNALARYILTPEPGNYAPMADSTPGQVHQIHDLSNSNLFNFSLGAGDGRFIGDQFNSDPDAGGSWNYLHWMRHAGFGVEKVFATMALADARPTLATISRENYLDGRAVKINFRSDMPEAVDRLLGGVLSEDWGAVGMFVTDMDTPKPRMTPISKSDAEPVRPAEARVLFPNIGYKQQLGMLIFAHVYSRMSSDMALSNKLRLWIDGQQGEVEIPLEQQTRFYDPESGYTYVARKYGSDITDGKVHDQGIASRMVARANALLIASFEVVRDTEGAPLLNEFGQPELVTDVNGHPVSLPADSSSAAQLDSYVGLMDAARQIATLVGSGPL